MSLRGRILLALLALVTLGLGVSDFATYTALERFLVQRVDQQLDRVRRPVELAFASAAIDPTRLFARGGPAGREDLYVQVRTVDGAILSGLNPRSTPTSTPKIPARLPSVPPTAAPPVTSRSDAAFTDTGAHPAVYRTVGSLQHGGPNWRLRVSALAHRRGTLIVALPMTDLSPTLHHLLRIEAAVSAGVVVAAVLIGLWLVRLGLRPLDGIETTAEAIAKGDLARRVPRARAGTEVGRLAVALNAMLSQIERAFAQRQVSEDRLRRFVADASHELRTPLTSIRGYAELFRRGAGQRPEDLAKTMRRIEEEASHMGLLVDDLLLLARLDQGRPLERQRLELGRVAADAVDAARVVDPSRPLTLESHQQVEVMADPARIRQVVDNLLANVRTHTPPRTPAHIGITADGGRAILEVADEGNGLSPEQAARAFERFFRADTSRARDRGGSGLGLAIVESIMTSLGGCATVSSQPGHGATFRIELPLLDRRDGTVPVAEPPGRAVLSPADP